VSISVVQGYVCYSSCDEAKARHGKNPHPKPGESEFSSPKIGGVTGPAQSNPGVTADGAFAPADAVTSAAALTNGLVGRTVDILV
jgi:hypothetical protein